MLWDYEFFLRVFLVGHPVQAEGKLMSLRRGFVYAFVRAPELSLAMAPPGNGSFWASNPHEVGLRLSVLGRGEFTPLRSRLK